MSSGLLLAVAAVLLGLAFALAALVLAGVVGLVVLRSRAPATPPAERVRADRTDPGSRSSSGRSRAVSHPPPAPPAREPRTIPTAERPQPALPPPQPSTAAALQPGPMIGFFDDETSTGAALQQARQSSLSTAFLNTLPPSKLDGKAPADDGDGDGDATEIFSANTISSELAALLEEPDEATPAPNKRTRGP